ncbi:amidase [Litorilinea aerophila]|nr:amidase [Litorilinea aerophila]
MYLYDAPLAPALKALQEGQHSLSLYVERMCRRLEQINPVIQAFLPEEGRLARLRQDVSSLRDRFPDPHARPPLYGALVGVKDIIHVDGFVTRAGSQLPPELFAGPEATCVRQLREAGALIMGKTVTTEFAYFEPGPTRNPHNLDHTPGGSSSGSAAAVAAGLCALALGTQTIGSVIRPAAYCGVVGFKPSLGRIATEGIIYFSRTVDHVGLFTQDVAGMALAAAVLCEGWQPVQPEALPVLGVPDGPYLAQAEPAALEAFEEQLLWLQVGGYEVRRVAALDDIQELNRLHRRLIFAEFAQEHAPFWEQYVDLYRPQTLEAIRTGLTVGPDELAAAWAHCLELRQELANLMAQAGIDLWACPAATGPAPAGLHATGDPNMNLPWTHAGMPAVTVPAGRTETGLPLGLQLVAPFGDDERLLAWAGPIAQRLAIMDG